MFSFRQERAPVDFLSSLKIRVIEEMKENLSKEFVAKDIITALKQMYPNKAPGPYGMSPPFFSKILGDCGIYNVGCFSPDLKFRSVSNKLESYSYLSYLKEKVAL